MENTQQRRDNSPVTGGKRRLAVRIAVVVIALVAWFGTQALIGKRAPSGDGIGDAILQWTAGINGYLNAHEAVANALLIVSSAVIDALGIFLILRAIVGPTLRPFVGLLIVMALRQISQGLCALPPPEGMIWRNPGVPSLLVTYGVANDLFFSGHTAVAVLGAVELGRLRGKWWIGLGFCVALFEIATVLVLRAHYTMDVLTGTIAALWAAYVAARLAPWLDRRF